jgi:hypothetical protein
MNPISMFQDWLGRQSPATLDLILLTCFAGIIGAVLFLIIAAGDTGWKIQRRWRPDR